MNRSERVASMTNLGRVRGIAGFLVWLAVALAPARAAADENADVRAAKERFQMGQQHYAAGDYQRALAEFESARLIKAVPEFDYNIAVCYERLGQTEAAIAAFRTFIDETIDPKAIADAKQHLDLLEAKRAAEPPKPAAPAAAPTPQALVMPAPSAPRSYAAPIGVGVGALALAAVGVALLLPVAHEYDYVSNSWDRQPSPQIAAEADYLKTRLEISYAMFAVAGAVAIVDVVLWARAGRRESAAQSPAARALIQAAPSGGRGQVGLGFTF